MHYLYLLGLPTIGLFLNFIFKPKSKADAILRVVALFGFNAFIYLTGSWIRLDSVYLMLVPSVVYNLIIVIQLIVRLIKLDKWWRFHWSLVLVTTLAVLVLIPIVKYKIIERPKKGILLEYPLKNGRYYVRQGGLLESMNYHLVSMKNHPNNEVQYAVDIVKINKNGSIKDNNVKSEVARHEIFLDTVYSPTKGIIKTVKDDEQDYTIEVPKRNPENKGNYITIKYKDILVVLGHLKMNSIIVEEGDSVRAGQPIALVGHNGVSSIPHLHIHALALLQSYLDEGDTSHYVYPIPMIFQSQNELLFLEKNDYVN